VGNKGWRREAEPAKMKTYSSGQVAEMRATIMVGLDEVPDGYRAMNERESIKVMVRP